MKNRSETRVTLKWILAQKEPFYGAQLARALDMHPMSACRQLRNLERNSIIERVNYGGSTILLYAVSDIDACQAMADYKPKPANGYTPVKQRPVKRIINSVWSLAN
jgi:predicted ArsR family transcriptional regulator